MGVDLHACGDADRLAGGERARGAQPVGFGELVPYGAPGQTSGGCLSAEDGRASALFASPHIEAAT